MRDGIARNVYITATDDKGAAARDLTLEEVTVKEDGTARTVLDVRPATEPMQAVLLIDDSGPGIRDVREGVASFIRIVHGFAEIAIVTTAKQNTGCATSSWSPTGGRSPRSRPRRSRSR